MKSISIVLLLVVSMLTGAYGQHNAERKNEKIKTLRIAYLTEKLNLTTDEATLFWPLLQEFETRMSNIKKEQRALLRFDTKIDDTDAESRLIKILDLEEEEVVVEREYFSRISQVIGARRVLKWKQAEHEFKRELLHKIKRRH